MIINKDLLDFSSVSGNLYKYIVIIGLSLFFIPSINSTNIVNIMSKQSEIGEKIDNLMNEIEQKDELLTVIENENTLLIEEVDNYINNTNNTIKNMNYSFPDGNQVLTINDLEKFIEITNNLMEEIIYDIRKETNINLIKNKLQILFKMFDNTNKNEDVTQNINNIFKKLDDTKIITDNIDNFILQKKDELNAIKFKNRL